MEKVRPATTLPNGAEGLEAFNGEVIRIVNVTMGDTEGGLSELLRGEIRHSPNHAMSMEWVHAPLPEGRAYRSASTLHMLAYGSAPDLPASDAEIRKTLEEIASELVMERIDSLSPDAVILHEAPSLGLAAALARRGVPVIWRFHLGTTVQNSFTLRFWSLVRDYLTPCSVVISHDLAYVPNDLPTRVTAVRPGIDPLSAKNSICMAPIAARTILASGTHAIENHTEGNDPIHQADFLLVQLSRWAPVKDPVSAIRIALPLLARAPSAHLLLAGARGTAPSVVSTRNAAIAQAASESPSIRRRIHIWSLEPRPEEGGDLSAGLVQCAGEIHLAAGREEGYGLAVAEAMWKHRPVVGRDIGGIGRQIRCCGGGVIGLTNTELSDALIRLFDDTGRLSSVGTTAHECVMRHGLVTRELSELRKIVEETIDGPGSLLRD